MTGSIYLISAGPHAVKIGYTKGDPRKRLRQIQTASFEKLAIVSHFPGSVEQEQLFHRVFSDLRLSGEWFKPDDMLLAAFMAVAEYAGGITARPPRTHSGLREFTGFLRREGARVHYPDGARLADYDFDELALWMEDCQ